MEENSNNYPNVGVPIKSNNYHCRQSGTRWVPTCDQVSILRDLYYNYGIRSPTAEQIQKISAQLRQYGKIEGKNVFYWFQNHKARERQKKRLTHVDMIPQTKLFTTTNMSTGVDKGSLYGAVEVESNFRVSKELSLCMSSIKENYMYGDGRDDWESKYNVGWVLGLESPVTAPWTRIAEAEEQEAAGAATSRKIETLPLFPIHSHYDDEEEEKYQQWHQYFPAFYCGEQDGQQYSSLELSLSSGY